MIARAVCVKTTHSRFFRVQIFRGSPLDHENHENITPRKIPAYGIYMYMYRHKKGIGRALGRDNTAG